MRRNVSSVMVGEHRRGDGAGVVDQDVQCAVGQLRRPAAAASAAAAASRTSSPTAVGAAAGGVDRRGRRPAAASLSMSVTSTAAPAAAKASATAAPMPLPAPVTSAERPSSRKTSQLRRSSVAPRQPEHVLAEVVQDHLLADRGDPGQPGLTEVAGDVVLLGVAHAAVRLQRAVGRVETGVGAQVLGRVGLPRRTACRCRRARSPCGASVRRRPAGPASRPAGTGCPGSCRSAGRTLPARCRSARRVRSAARPMPERLGRDQACAPGSGRRGCSVKPWPSSPTRSSTGTSQAVDEQLVGADRVSAHLGDRPDVDLGAVEVGEEQGQAVGLRGDVLELRGAGEQQDLLRLHRLGDPHLAAVDDVVGRRRAGRRW